AAEATLSISSVAMLVWVLKDLLWTPASLVLISSRTRRFQFLFTEELITITPSALFQERLRCVIQFLAHESRRTPGLVWVRFSAAAKEMSFTHSAHRMPLLSTRRRITSGAKPKCSANLEPVWNSGSRDTLQ